MAFKYPFFILFFNVYLINAFGQVTNLNCVIFKTGTFVYRDYPFNTINVKRTKRKQIENDKYTGLKVKYKIKWVNNCEYNLIQVGSNNEKIKTLNKTSINVKIIQMDSASYKYIANQGGVISSNTLVKLK